MDMSFNPPLLAAGLLLSLTAINADAALTSYTSVGQSLVYSSVSDVTWIGDANLLGTMISNQGYYNVVNAIIFASPIIRNTPNFYDGSDGSYSISAADFSSNYLGRTTWFGAQAFTSYLNSINYAGSHQWVLPDSGDNPQSGFYQTGGQFGQLIYLELGGSAGNNIPHTENFINEQAFGYWSSSEYELNPDVAWGFATLNNAQGRFGKNIMLHAWAVSPGQASAVPIPGAIWLFGTGFFVLLGLKPRGNAR